MFETFYLQPFTSDCMAYSYEKLLLSLAGLIFAGLAFPVLCATGSGSIEEVAKAMAQKDYESARKKIEADDNAAIANCGRYHGSAVSACMIQAHGKRERAEADAKATVERAGQTPPLPDGKAKIAAKAEIAKAKNDRKAVNRNIADERNAAVAECSKLNGTERKACIKDVDARRAEALELTDAIYKKSVQSAKALAPP